jgi:hypothetical protein
LPFREAYALALSELVHRDAHERGLMEENVFAGFRRDETESFVRQSLDGAFCHGVLLVLEVERAAPLDRRALRENPLIRWHT